MFTAPTAFRAIKKEDPEGKFIRQYDLSKFRTLFLAGERADPPTVEWAEQQLKVPVIDHWWQTETGWCIAGNPVGLGMLPVKHGSPTVPMPGYQVDVVDEAAKPVAAGTMGSIVIKLPMPPACLPTLWQQDARFREAYLTEFPGYYKTSDAGYKDEDGYVFVMGRTDDIINVAGHRLSTGGMEEILASHPDVAECAVLGIKDAIKGEVPCGFLVLKAGVTREPGRDREGRSWRWCAKSSARSPPSSSPSRSAACRRRARERSCAAPSRRSPTATPGPCRRRSRIPRCWTRSATR